ncbi:MAG: hypothetical protein GY743_20620 [Planctomycetaceae bacterium]|nr:hypothetical protein [Planctomycetaceae bacterium]
MAFLRHNRAEHTERCIGTNYLRMYIVDAVGHTNRINACVNGILKSFLDSRHSFRNLETPQACLDLFLLWHNTRIIQWGKGKDFSILQASALTLMTG